MSSTSASPLSRALSKASFVPSGENAGAESKTSLLVSCTTFVPSASMRGLAVIGAHLGELHLRQAERRHREDVAAQRRAEAVGAERQPAVQPGPRRLRGCGSDGGGGGEEDGEGQGATTAVAPVCGPAGHGGPLRSDVGCCLERADRGEVPRKGL